jgi:pimeloyl-ACP methyl ester carboxylesterase
MTTRDSDVRRTDGRVLRVQDSDATELPAVFVLHGTPGSRVMHDGVLAIAADAGVRLLCYDRPGCGGSTPQPGRIIADGAGDVAAIADELGIDRFAVVGASGGGSYALACAALLPDRVVAAATLTSLAPFDAPGLDWFAGMAEINVQQFTLAAAGREAVQPLLEQMAEGFKAVDPAQFVQMYGPGFPPPDRAILDTTVASYILGPTVEGLAPGVEGFVEDELAVVAPWGVDLAGVLVPVALWQGEQDQLIPPGHARWLADAIPGAELQLYPDEGHLSIIFGRDREVIAWLAEQLHRSS